VADGADDPPSVAVRLLAAVALILAKLDELLALHARRQKSHLTVEEVAEVIGRSAYTVRRWIAEGRINAVRVEGTGPRGRLLIPRSELEKIGGGGLGGDVPDTELAD
jgi:excisionase family DNA binding protein